MAKIYKSSLKRLVKFFENSRNSWRVRANNYQADKRRMQTEIRDLQRSKNKWKVKCIKLKTEVAVLKKKNEPIREITPLSPALSNITNERLPSYSFPIWQQVFSIKVYMSCNSGFRGTARMFEIMQSFFNTNKMSYNSIRGWVLRLGYGLLHQPVERRDDWVYILDFSIQLGRERCLLILGVTRESLITDGYELTHKQVKVLDIFVKSGFTGEEVQNRLDFVQKKTGTPYQTVSDGGKDIIKGIQLFCEQNSSTIATYEASHMIGVVLKHHLQNNAQWKELQEDLNTLTQEIKQTEMSFLRPVSITKKARWLNIQKQVDWLRNICRYEDCDDFSLIQTGYKIENNAEILETLGSFCENKRQNNKIKKQIDTLIFEEKDDVYQWVEQNSDGNKIPKEDIKLIDAGKQRFDEKFNILDKNKKFILELEQIVQVAETIKRTVGKEGLSLDVFQKLEYLQTPQICSSARAVYFDIINRLQVEHSKCGAEKTPLLCSSDIIESIFGKFKMKAKQSVGGIYETVLNIAIFCNDVTDDIIKNVMPSVKMEDVQKWFSEMAGVSNLAKRRVAFKRIRD